MLILTALGAKCTVLDYSKQQCESERFVAEREGYEIEIIRADMTKRLPSLFLMKRKNASPISCRIIR